MLCYLLVSILLQYAGEEVYMGTPATRWEYRYLAFGLLNTHTLLVSKLNPSRPVRYEMKGYDSLMASYYDNYVLEYISFEDWKPDLERFELPKGKLILNLLMRVHVLHQSCLSSLVPRSHSV